MCLNLRLQACDIRFRIRQIRLCLLELCPENRGIDLCDKLTLFHMRIEIDVELVYVSGDLRTHLHGGHGIDRPCGRNDLDDIPVFHFGCVILRCRSGAEMAVDEHEQQCRTGKHGQAGPLGPFPQLL